MLNAWCDDPVAEMRASQAAARKAVQNDETDAASHVALGLSAIFLRQAEDSLAHFDTALGINPNMASAHGCRAATLGCMGLCDAAIASFEEAITRSPRDHLRLFWMAGLGAGFLSEGRYKEALDNVRAMMRIEPEYGPAHRQLCSALALDGQIDAARQAMVKLREIMPDLTVSQVGKMVPMIKPEANERWLNGLRLAGLPE